MQVADILDVSQLLVDSYVSLSSISKPQEAQQSFTV